MNTKKPPYIANPVDQHGFVSYSREETRIWSELLYRQVSVLKERACDEYLHGLELLRLPSDRIPQCFEINQVLKKQTSWIITLFLHLFQQMSFFTCWQIVNFPLLPLFVA